jgi:probable F420-dependent oxidoreductase
MKIDLFLADGISGAPERARRAEDLGFDAVWTGEVAHDPLLPLAAAALATRQIQLGTAITLAFARSPMSVAYQSWDLAAASQGRFILGLGAQVRAHVTRRFSMPWHQPVAQMREYVQALRAIYAAWQDGVPLDFRGDHYAHTLMTPVFDPGPLPAGHQPAVALAAVGAAMTRLAGELCDGVFLHPFTHAGFVDQVTLPALAEGAARATGVADKDRPWIFSYMFLVVGDTEHEQLLAEARIRKQLAFYASTPAYAQVLRTLGAQDLQPELQRLSKLGRWDEMSTLIEPDLLGRFVLRGTLEELPAQIAGRYAGRADRVASYYPLPDYDDGRLADFATAVRKAADAAGSAEAAGGAR